jgi:type IX secretion system PorP/SprF family membrane protein
MKNKTIITLFALLCFGTMYAQQLQTSSLYENMVIMHNPSAVGTMPTNYVGLSYRSQWSGLSGAPKTANVLASIGLDKYKIGLGGSLFQDKTGPTSRTGLALSFAKHLPISEKAMFSLGLETRLQQYALNKQKLAEYLGPNDPAIGGANNAFKYDAGFGVSYTSPKLQLGAAASQLVQSKLNFYTGNLTPTGEALLYRHYYLHGNYNIVVDEQNVISPNAMFIFLPNAPLYYQIGAKVDLRELFWFGGAIRSDKSYTINLGVNVKKSLSVGYAYDAYINPISLFDYGGNAHEIILKFNLPKSGKASSE